MWRYNTVYHTQCGMLGWSASMILSQTWHYTDVVWWWVFFLHRPLVIFPHTVVGIRANLPAGWLINWNICKKEEKNSYHETNYSKAKEAYIWKMTKVVTTKNWFYMVVLYFHSKAMYKEGAVKQMPGSISFRSHHVNSCHLVREGSESQLLSSLNYITDHYTLLSTPRIPLCISTQPT